MTTNVRTVAFQGDRGAHSEAALHRHFGADAAARNYSTFENVFEAVYSGETRYGILPIENSYTGSVLSTYDLLHKYDVQIVGEQYLGIVHHLMGVRGSSMQSITDVYSHEQALMQCKAYLDKHPHMKLHPYFNTAVSAKYVAECRDATKAAIAGEYAAQIYELDILVYNINDSAYNTTRFIIISRNAYSDENADKASVSFVLSHEPGALAKVLHAFAQNQLNMVKIESRPLAGKNFEYLFYVDFEGANVGKTTKEVLKNNRDLFITYRLLGVYESAHQED